MKKLKKKKDPQPFVEDLKEFEEEKETEPAPFVCPHCGHTIKSRTYKGMIKEYDTTSTNAALRAIIEGCPKCGKVNQPMYDYVMKVNCPPRRPAR